MTFNGAAMEDYERSSAGTTVEIANGSFAQVTECGRRSCRSSSLTIQKALLYTRSRSFRIWAGTCCWRVRRPRTLGKEIRIVNDPTVLGSGESACRFHTQRPEPYGMEAKQSAA